MTQTERWYDDPELVLDFGKLLHRAMVLSPTKMADFYRNPKDYDTMRSIWVEHGMPNHNSNTWSDFVESLRVTA